MILDRLKELRAVGSPGKLKAMVDVDGRMRLAYYDEDARDFVYLAEFHVDFRRRDANVANAKLAALAPHFANLTAQLEEELDKRRNPGNPHLRESDHAGEGGCPQDCLDFRAALKACRKFQEKYQ